MAGNFTQTIAVDGLEVTLTRKNMKSIRLRVKEPSGEVAVSAPHYVPLSKIYQMVRDKRDWIEEQQRRISEGPSAQAASATPEEKKQWKALVSACVPVLMEVWEPIIGVKALKLDYRCMKSRWGSCQPSTGRICINTRLALYPPECLEYVVVHELCHLREANHGPKFHALLDTYMPDWKAREKKLR